MLSTSPRSTLHSDMFLGCDVTHSSPYNDKDDFRPSTPLFAILCKIASCSHADLFRATFSKNKFQTIQQRLVIENRAIPS